MSDLRPSSDPNPQEWLRFAENDLRVARTLRGNPDILPVATGFDAPQCVEKAVKSLLINARARFPFTHDLEPLFELYHRGGHAVPFDFEALNELTPYAGHRRYPGWIHQPSTAELERLLTLAEQVLTWAANIINPPEPRDVASSGA